MPKTALLVIDMFNPYDHEDADALVDSVEEALPQIVKLRDRAMEADETMLVYVNDNYEHWEYSRETLVNLALDGERPDLVEPLVPDTDVPFIAKGRHSIFYQTSVAHLLQVSDIERLVMCGQVTEQCIQYSVLDAYLRGYDLHVPRDAVAHINEDWARAALEMMEGNMHAELTGVADGALEAVSR